MKWTAPIELFIDVALILCILEVISRPAGTTKTQRKNDVHRSGEARVLPLTTSDLLSASRNTGGGEVIAQAL